jgi:serine/threonine protein kinase
MGELYRGIDTLTGQQVVIKRLRPELIYEGSEMVARFAREGELLRRLGHPNIVMFFGVEKIDGRVQLVMEYVPGGSLRELLQTQSRLSISQAVTLTMELADALGRAHHLGIIHRDLKPENILLAADGSPRLTDFGIAYELYQQTRLTQPGVIMGTVSYLSPEGCQGAELDSASDVWSLGALLYEMLAGQNPFAAGNMMATMLAVLHEPLPNLAAIRPDAPGALIALIHKMLTKQPASRLSSMRQVAAELERIQKTIFF